MLLLAFLALGLFRRAAAARDRRAARREGRAAALRLPRGGAAEWRHSAAHPAAAAPGLSRARARPLAELSRHAASPEAALLPAARQQGGGADGDRGAAARARRDAAEPRHPRG